MLKQFYEDVLPRHGNLCLFTLPDAQHFWGLTIDEMVLKTERLRGSNCEIYFAVAAFKARARNRENADTLRALRVDLDAGPEKLAKHGPEKVYTDQGAALVGLVQFVKDTNLVPTYIVSSGEGLHVYWALDNDIEPREWLPLAEALQVLGDQRGLKIDHTVTCNSAGVLRPLDTIHHKSGNPVTVLKATGKKWRAAEMRAALSAHVEVAAPGKRLYQNGHDVFAALGDVPLGGDASINAEAMPQYPPSDANLVADQCPVMGHIRETGGQVAEPLWHAMMGVVKYTVQGDEAAHAWSDGDARYDEYDTQRKYDAWTAGPTTCKHIAQHDNACKTCPHWGTIVTPVELGRPRTAPSISVASPSPPRAAPPDPQALLAPGTKPPWEGFIPPGYRVKHVGTHYAMFRETDGDETDAGQPMPKLKLLCNEVFWLTAWGRADGDEPAVIDACVIPHTGNTPTTHRLPQTCMASVNDAMKAMSKIGVHSKDRAAMLNYLQDSTQIIKAIQQRERIPDRLGLRYLPSGELVAVHGHHIIHKDGRIELAMVSADLAPVAALFPVPLPNNPAGNWTPDVWPAIEAKARQHVAFIRKHFTGLPKMQIAMLTVLASPLMAFVTGEYMSGPTLPRLGFTVSLYSRQSGQGKTHAAKIGLLAYGPPDGIMMSGDASSATDIARITRLTLHGTMPMVVDELGSAEVKKVADFISTVANGAARERGTKSGGVKVNTPWALSTVVTTNVAARQMILANQESSDAIQNRLLEINADDVPNHTPEERLAYQMELPAVAECAGALGALIHREIVKLGGTEINRAVLGGVAKAEGLLGKVQAGRFANRQLGTILVLNAILEKAGIGALFPLGPIVMYFKQAFESGQEFISTSGVAATPVEQLADYLNSAQRVTVVTNMNVVQGNNGRVPDEISVRYCIDEDKVFISKEHLSEWCKRRGLQTNDLINQLGDYGVLNEVKGGKSTNKWLNKQTVTKGLHATVPISQIRCITVFVSKMSIALGQEVNIQPASVATNVIPLTR